MGLAVQVIHDSGLQRNQECEPHFIKNPQNCELWGMAQWVKALTTQASMVTQVNSWNSPEGAVAYICESGPSIINK